MIQSSKGFCKNRQQQTARDNEEPAQTCCCIGHCKKDCEMHDAVVICHILQRQLYMTRGQFMDSCGACMHHLSRPLDYRMHRHFVQADVNSQSVGKIQIESFISN